MRTARAKNSARLMIGMLFATAMLATPAANANGVTCLLNASDVTVTAFRVTHPDGSTDVVTDIAPVLTEDGPMRLGDLVEVRFVVDDRDTDECVRLTFLSQERVRPVPPDQANDIGEQSHQYGAFDSDSAAFYDGEGLLQVQLPTCDQRTLLFAGDKPMFGTIVASIFNFAGPLCPDEVDAFCDDLRVDQAPGRALRVSWNPEIFPVGMYIIQRRAADSEEPQVGDPVFFIREGDIPLTDTSVQPGETVRYILTVDRIDGDTAPCGSVVATAIPSFPGVLGFGLASVGAIAAFVLGRRK